MQKISEKPNLSRYDQHMDLPGVGPEGQAKIFNARVLIVGMGALGCPVALYLTAAGVGEIGIIDGDVVSTSNLARQIIYSNDDVGQKKVSVAQKSLMRRADRQKIIAYDQFLTKENAEEIISKYDLVIDATDNHITRLLINKICLHQKKSWIYGALYRFEGQTMAFGKEGGPCYSCLFPNVTEESSLPTCKSAGVLGPLPGVVGSLQAVHALQLILGAETPACFCLNLVDLLTYEIKRLNVARNSECRICQLNV